MNYFAIAITLLTLAITFWKPGAGIALAAQAYIIRSSLPIGTDYISTTTGDNSLSIVLPVVVFTIIGIRSFKHWRYYQFHYIDILLVVLGFWLLFSSIFSPDRYLGLEITLRYFGLGISFYFFARLIPLTDINTPEENLSVSIRATWVIAVFLGILALLSGISQGFGFNRLSVGTANPIPFSLTISMGIITNIYWLFFNKKSLIFIKSFMYICLGFLTLILIATKTRSVLVAIAISVVFLKIQLMKKQLSIKTLVIVITVIILIVGVIYSILYWHPLLFEQWTKRILLVFNYTNKDQSISERFLAKDVALKIFYENPLFGVGTGGFRFYTFLPYPHNLVLEIASEQGIFGLCILSLFLSLILSCVFSAIKLRNHCSISILFAAWVLLNLVVAQFSFTLWQHKNLFLSLGMLVSCITNQQREQRPFNR